MIDYDACFVEEKKEGKGNPILLITCTLLKFLEEHSA